MKSTGNTVSKNKTGDITLWVEQHTKDLLSWAVYKTSDKELAEDLVQDVFLVAAEKYETFKGDSQPKTWLFAILNNKIAEHFRKLSSRPQPDPLSDDFFNEKGRWKDDAKPTMWPDENEQHLLDEPEFIKCIIPFSARPLGETPVTLLSASGLQYVLTSENTCAVFVSR